MQSEQEDRPDRESLSRALEGSSEDLRSFLDSVHSADLAEWVVDIDRRDLRRVLFVLQVEDLSELLRFTEDTVCEVLLDEMTIEQIVRVVEELPADEVVDLLSHVDEQRAESVLRSVEFERAQGLRKLARYDEQTAGGLMTTEYMTVGLDAHIGDAIKLIRNEAGPAAEEGDGVFVIDAEGRPVGHLSDRELLTTPIHTPVSEVMESDLITVGVGDDQEDVAQLVRKYDFDAVPVVDSDGVLLGVVSADDAQEVLAEEAEEDILRMVGASPKELQTRLSVLTRVRHRLPLQGLTVLGGLATAALLDFALPESSAGGATDILRYLPIIIGLAGNVGIQSSTILVRAMATGELTRDRERSVFASEFLVGMLIGVICGLVTMGVATFVEDSMPNPALFAAAVGGAIAVAVAWAAFLGCAVPISCDRLGIDPAIVAGPFLITLSDVSGATIFIGVAFLVLGLGG